MEKEKFDEMINDYGKAIHRKNTNKKMNISVESYPIIVMWNFAQNCFDNQDIHEVNVGKPYSILKSRKEVAEIFDSISTKPNKVQLYEFINYLSGNEYRAGKDFNLKFEQNKSNLEIILKKRK